MPSPLARPDNEARRRLVPLAGGAIVVALVAIAGTLFFSQESTTSAYQKSACSPETTVTCLVSWSRTSIGGTAVFNRPAGREFRYRIGEKSDVMLTGNWFCGLGETLAVYRPSTGVVYYFPSWPRDQTKLDQPVLADLTGMKNRRVGIGDRNGDRCADLGLASGDDSTWFLPAIQRARLVELPSNLALQNGASK
jgi:hypothetical protein